MGNRVCRLLQLALLLLLVTLLALVNASSGRNQSSSSSRAVSYLREKSQHIPSLLRRQKRWLIFELGTSITVSRMFKDALYLIHCVVCA